MCSSPVSGRIVAGQCFSGADEIFFIYLFYFITVDIKAGASFTEAFQTVIQNNFLSLC